MGQIGRRRADEADWAGGGRGRMGQTRKPGTDVPADWADRLGCGCPGRSASLRLRAEGI